MRRRECQVSRHRVERAEKNIGEKSYSLRLALCSSRLACPRSAADKEIPPHRLSNGPTPFPLARRSQRRHSGKVCASLVTWRGKPLSLSGDLPKESRWPFRACDRASASQGRYHRHGWPTATRAVKEATTTIPIVMVQDSDPVGNGFVASLARPGGNIQDCQTLPRS